MRIRRAGCCTGIVRRIQSECWPDTGECLEPIVVYRCDETDKQNDLYRRHTPETQMHGLAVVTDGEAILQ